MKTFRLQTSKLLGNRRKTYILDLMFNKFYFRVVQEKVLGQCSGKGYISQHLEQNIFLSISGLFQKKASMVVDEVPF